MYSLNHFTTCFVNLSVTIWSSCTGSGQQAVSERIKGSLNGPNILMVDRSHGQCNVTMGYVIIILQLAMLAICCEIAN